METTSLESVYERILQVASDSSFTAPEDGGWPPEMVLAHLKVNDDALIETLREVLANTPNHRYDNAAAIDEDVLRAQGTLPEVIDSFRTSSRQVCDLAAQLGPLADTPVVVHLEDGDQVVVDDEAWPMSRLVQFHVDVHLPSHLRQLEGLRS